MAKQTGTEETATRSSSTRPGSCANCAKQVCPSLRFFESSPKTGIAISSSNESQDALCWPQNECNHQELPGVEQRGFWNNWSRCFPGCTRPAGSGAIASHRTFLFIAERCDSSISREHAALIKPNYCPGVHQIISRHRYRGKFSRRAGTFEDDYALGVIAFQFQSGKFPPAAAHRRAALYKRTGCPESLRRKIDRLLSSKILRTACKVIRSLENSLHLGNSFHSSRLYGFFCELRRRKVWRVAAGYGVVGWLIIQFATTVFPALTLPDLDGAPRYYPRPGRLSDCAHPGLGV